MAFGYDGTIRINSQIDTKGFNKGMRNLSRSFSGLLRTVGGFAVLNLGARAFGSLIRGAVDLSATLTEVQNLVDQTFTDMSRRVDLFALTTIDAFGMSQLTAKEMSATFMQMATSMGIADRDAANMSLSLTALAGDLASLRDVDFRTVQLALQAVFTGLVRPMRKFGITLSVAALEEYAAAKGMEKLYMEMSEAEKAMVRYLYVVENLAVAQGDFARTQMTWSNQMRTLKERLQEIGILVGDIFVKIFLPVLQRINVAAADLLNWLRQIDKLLNPDKYNFSDALDENEDGFDDMVESAEELEASLKKLLIPFDDLTVLGEQATSMDFTGLIPEFEDPDTSFLDVEVTPRMLEFVAFLKRAYEIMVAYRTAVIEFFEDMGFGFGELSNVASVVFSKLEEGINILIDSFSQFMTGVDPEVFASFGDTLLYIVDLIYDSFNKLVEAGFWQEFGVLITSILSAVTSLVDLLGPIVEWLLDLISNVLDDVAKLFAGDVMVIEGLISLVREFLTLDFNGMYQALLKIAQGVVMVGESVWEFLVSIWDNLTEYVGKYLKEIIANVEGYIDIVKDFVDKLMVQIVLLLFTFEEKWNWFWGKIKDQLVEYWELIETFFSEIWKGITIVAEESWNSIKESALFVFETIGNAFINFFKLAGEGFIELWQQIKKGAETISEGFTEIWNGILDGLEFLGEGFIEIWNSIGDIVKTSWETIESNAKEGWKSFKEWFNSIWEGISEPLEDVWDDVEEKFTSVWESIKKTFQKGGNFFDGIMNSIEDVFKSLINTLIDGINWVIEQPFKGINSVLKDLKSISILGAKPFNFISTIDIPSIPHLATGAVIPPNNKFLAMLGDQKYGTNIETPEKLLRQIIAEGNVAVANLLAERLDKVIDAVKQGTVVYLDGRELTKGLNPYTDELKLVKGVK